jgi:hypothetical protein
VGLYTYHMGDSQQPTIRSLIETQSRLFLSKNTLRRFGALVVAGVLDKRLTELRDKQIGQLVFDFVLRDLVMGTPEMTICHHAVVRLTRSTAGRISAEEIERQQERRLCPRCGNEMLRHYGIEEPDCWQCVSLACEHKGIIDSNEGTR